MIKHKYLSDSSITYVDPSQANLDESCLSTVRDLNNETEIHDPNLDEDIICVELENNNKVYIEYERDWKIKDVSFCFNFLVNQGRFKTKGI